MRAHRVPEGVGEPWVDVGPRTMVHVEKPLMKLSGKGGTVTIRFADRNQMDVAASVMREHVEVQARKELMRLIHEVVHGHDAKRSIWN